MLTDSKPSPSSQSSTMLFNTVLFLSLLFATVHAQAPDPNKGADRREFGPVQPGSSAFNSRRNGPCDLDVRSFDGTCTNPTEPARKLWGSTNRPQFSYFGNPDTSTFAENGLLSPRSISNMLFSTNTDIFDARGLSEMATFFGQFIDHTLTAVPLNRREEEPIEIPEGDPFFDNHTNSAGDRAFMPFFRSVRVRVSAGGPERPSNSLTSTIDLDSVYGPSKRRQGRLSTGRDGLLKVSSGDFLPLNGRGRNNFNNAPPDTFDDFFLAGDHRANEHPVLTCLHTMWVREHNRIAAIVKSELGLTRDNDIFEAARKITIALMQKIVFNIWYPAMTGRNLPAYNGFQEEVDTTVSLIFSTAAFRIGHTMVGNNVKRKGPGNSNKPAVLFTEMFFNSATRFRSFGIEDFVRGALSTRAQKIDILVRDSLRNFLFENVEGEEGFDLMALNLQRSRDHNLPTYNEVREEFGIGRATGFADVTSSGPLRSKLQNVYTTVDNIEPIVGLFAEDTAPGSSMGQTMLAIWEREFVRIRNGDSFYYEQDGYFSAEEQGLDIVQEILSNEDSFRGFVLRNTDVAPADYPSRSFFAS